jgi:diguanylate cyclase (GGDEF)-like protein
MVDSVLLPDRVISSPDAAAPFQRPLPGKLAVSDLSADASVSNSTSAFLLCREDFSIVCVSGLLQIFLKLPDERGHKHSRDIFALLGGSGVLQADSVETVLGPMRQSGLHSTTVYLKTGAAEDQLELQVQPAGEGQWMLAFEDAHAHGNCRTQLLAMTLTDSLVGTNNRRCFQQAVKSSLAEKTPGTVLLLDLDRFKAVNDTLGHPVGDQLLRKVGERLRTIVGDDLLARLGGDEFAVWSDSVDAGATEAMAAKIVEMLGRPFLIDGQQVNIGVSVGIAHATEDDITYERLMKCADLALYAAKESGRNCVRCFLPAMEAAAQSRRKLELEVRKALTLRQFEVHYQPRINIESGATIGVEAVLRWRHPERGLLEPSSFMALAEEIGLTFAIGKWMLKIVCRDAAALCNVPRVSMRLMQAQFTHRESLEDTVKQALGSSGIGAERLELEITEGLLLHRQEHVLKTLHSLRALGVSIGMGEFGTGYASLSKLVSFPFDRIRMASSLADETSPTPTHRAIIHAVAMLGSSLGVSTLIDGIQTRDQLDCLRGEAGAAVQGCRLDEAVTTDSLAALFTDNALPA